MPIQTGGTGHRNRVGPSAVAYRWLLSQSGGNLEPVTPDKIPRRRVLATSLADGNGISGRAQQTGPLRREPLGVVDVIHVDACAGHTAEVASR